MLMQKHDYIRTSYLSVFSIQSLKSKSAFCAALRQKILFFFLLLPRMKKTSQNRWTSFNLKSHSPSQDPEVQWCG